MKKSYEIISLGFNCQPRTYLTQGELLKNKKQGRLSMIFDLTIHHTKGLIEILKNEFSDYFENFEYGLYELFGLNYWQIKRYEVVFNHDSDCKENALEKIKKRYENRLENFKRGVNSDSFIFFIHNADEFADSGDINRLYETIKSIRGELPFKLLIWDMFENIEKNKIDKNISIYQLLHPYEDFSDWFKFEKQNVVTKFWKMHLIDWTITQIEESGFEVQYYKHSMIDKLKEKIKPILKNIFTITNDTELNAKVVILFGFKFKLKPLRK